MATTWQKPLTDWLEPHFDASVQDELSYRFRREGDTLTYTLQRLDGSSLSLPVRTLVGGRRHGLGFLASIEQLDGIPLARPALIQARYAWSPEQSKLLIAPGGPEGPPQSLEPALGLALSPTFESRCLSCHGEPKPGVEKTGGVHCESCHGPGSQHLVALGRHDAHSGVINPKSMSNEESIAICGRCHTGLTRFADPSGSDLLIANQARAITSSECYVQSGKGFSCASCHDPHSDASDDKKATAACLGCHSAQASPHAAICPVNRTTGCIGCHMPGVQSGPLHLVDHLIRVHPEQKVTLLSNSAGGRTQIRPVNAQLRVIVTQSAADAESVQRRLREGESFYQAALKYSIDPSAAVGGYLGSRPLPEQAAELGYGETSGIIQDGTRWKIWQRLPRDFRWQAEHFLQEAQEAASRGNASGGIDKAQQALMLYPHFLRAINFIGMTFANAGNPMKGAEVLRVAAKLYPQDAGTKFMLASVQSVMNDQAAAADLYRQVIDLEPDFTGAYSRLGRLRAEAGELQSAATIFRQGLQIDPLSQELYEGLGEALERSGDTAGASQAKALAKKLKLDLKTTALDRSALLHHLGSF